MNIVFAGTPEFAAQTLAVLLEEPRFNIRAVYTQPDRPKGRGRKLVPSPVKALASQHDISVFQPKSFKEQADIDALRELDADVLVVVAYGLILPQAVLDTPRIICINIHASLLPRWRGAAPIERAISAGQRSTGISIMQMDAGLDTGPVIAKHTCAIDADDTGDSVRAKLAQSGSAALLEVLLQIQASGAAPATEAQNDDQATYAEKIEKSEQAIDWTQPAEKVDAKIRAFFSTYTTYTYLQEQRLKLGLSSLLPPISGQHETGTIIAAGKQGIDVACATVSKQTTVLRLHALQLPGARMLDVAQIMNSKAELFQPGKKFAAHAAS